DTIKGAARILIEKSIYSTEDQIKSESKPNYRAVRVNSKADVLFKIYKRPRVEITKIERNDQDDLSNDSKEAENEPENNDSRASSSSSSDDDNGSKKEMDDDSKKKWMKVM
ncbi:31576_t:CDS:2, partial [Gigaspora margarita]